MNLATLNELPGLLQSSTSYELDYLLKAQTSAWLPLPGPQMHACLSPADELFFGGSAGSGKTDLLLGLTLNHRRSIIFRREYPQLRSIIERSTEIFASLGTFNGADNAWRFVNGATLEFGAVQHPTDVKKYQGRAHSFKAFDELANFTEAQYRFLIGWARTTVPGERVRVVSAGNPPTDIEGEWVIRYWAPWLDSQHPNPARPGELRWFATIAGDTIERESGAAFTHKGETIKPKSRTFIPARLSDNPYLLATDYEAVLQGMPEPLRSQMLYGNFEVGVDDNPWQVIPTAWVRAAQDRWTDRPPDGPQSVVGVDVARGGKDQTVLACRYGTWLAPLQRFAGTDTPDGSRVAAAVADALRRGGLAHIDVIGVGASVYDLCRQQSLPCAGINFASAATTPGPRGQLVPALDRSGTMRFANVRAHAYWGLREALDPQQGDSLALPPDRELLADLCSARWSMRPGGILIESKEDITKRIGRSPDAGDAVALAFLPVQIAPVSVLFVGKAKGW